MARHLAIAMGIDDCAISYWDRPNQRVVTLGFYPETPIEALQPMFDVRGYPQTLRVLEQRATITIDVDDPAADPAEVALLVGEGNRSVVMLPLVVKGQSIGLVELISRTAVGLGAEQLELARTMANEAAMALENARLYEEARALADRDPLTGFYNHRYLHQRLAEEVGRAKRGRRPLSVLMLDLDAFKLVNDTFGHLYGDQVLSWTAEIIRSTLRTSDVAARYGGDEFAVLLPETSADDATKAADRIREAFASAAHVGQAGQRVDVSLSIGVATFPGDGRTATELIASADAALYRDKRDPEARQPATPPARPRMPKSLTA
jgi:diguanylate cyclase (GGDEF)-like protein